MNNKTEKPIERDKKSFCFISQWWLSLVVCYIQHFKSRWCDSMLDRVCDKRQGQVFSKYHLLKWSSKIFIESSAYVSHFSLQCRSNDKDHWVCGRKLSIASRNALLMSPCEKCQMHKLICHHSSSNADSQRRMLMQISCQQNWSFSYHCSFNKTTNHIFSLAVKISSSI